jgi:hypothetical protein
LYPLMPKPPRDSSCYKRQALRSCRCEIAEPVLKSSSNAQASCAAGVS